jgi:protein AaeX
MRFTEINLLGVYVAPISVLMVVAWVATIWLRWVAARSGLLSYIWHPALFVFSIYLMVLSSLAFIVAS